MLAGLVENDVERQRVPPEIVTVTLTVIVLPGATSAAATPLTKIELIVMAACAWPAIAHHSSSNATNGRSHLAFMNAGIPPSPCVRWCIN